MKATATSTPEAKPDFSTMNLAGLLTAYNTMSVSKRKAAFKNKAEGVLRCENLWASLPKPAPAPEPADLPTKPAVVKEKPAKAAKSDETKTKKGDDRTIKVLAKSNPRREGTHAHAHFEKMSPGLTVQDYLKQFPEADRRTARQWLWNTVRDGHVELVAAKD